MSFFKFVPFQLLQTDCLQKNMASINQVTQIWAISAHQYTVDFFLDFCLVAKTCRVKIVSHKNDILSEIIKSCSSKLSFLQAPDKLLIIFYEHFLTISHKILFLRLTILTRHVFAAKQKSRKKSTVIWTPFRQNLSDFFVQRKCKID